MAESRVLVIDADEQNAASLASVLQFIDFIPVCVSSAADIKPGERKPGDYLAVIVGNEPDAAPHSAASSNGSSATVTTPPLLVSPARQEALCDEYGLDRSACFALEQPVRYAQLNDLLRRAGLVRMDQEAAANRLVGPTGNSAPIRKVRRMIEQVAGHDTTVLVTGESGTGKEVVAPPRCTSIPIVAASRSWRSTAARSRPTCSNPNCSATRRGPSPAPSPRARAASRWPTAARCFSTRSAT